MVDGLSSLLLTLKRYFNSVGASRTGWARVFKTVQFWEMGWSQDNKG